MKRHSNAYINCSTIYDNQDTEEKNCPVSDYWIKSMTNNIHLSEKMKY